MNACVPVIEMPLSSLPGQISALPSLRVGIVFGEVVQEDRDLFGDPMKFATYIGKQTNSGRILATAVIEQGNSQLVRTGLRRLSGLTIKDRSAPMEIYEIMRAANDNGALA